MKRILPSNKIYISKSKIVPDERGVFARENIKKGEIIETCPVIEFSEHDSSNFKESHLTTYTYYFGKNKDLATILLGYGSIYNHSHQPNAKYKENNMSVVFTAAQNIKKDEEILVNYLQENKNSNIPLWFEIY